MTVIQNALKKGSTAARYDVMNFSKWDKKEITLDECMEEFFRNNSVCDDDKAIITPRLFYGWLLGLGYRNGISGF